MIIVYLFIIFIFPQISSHQKVLQRAVYIKYPTTTVLGSILVLYLLVTRAAVSCDMILSHKQEDAGLQGGHHSLVCSCGHCITLSQSDDGGDEATH